METYTERVKDVAMMSPYAKVKVYWNDRPENYSKEGKNRIKSHISKKYGVSKNNVDVIYIPVKFTDSGEIIEISNATIENILDINYQRELMKEWIKRENKIVDFDRVLKLDDKINAELNIENSEVRHKTWAIKWITINNFLSFGENNALFFNKLKGLTVVNSTPPNQGGKTTLTIDALKFLLHGNTTKTDKNEEIFNQFTDKNELLVRGMISIGEEEVIIERKMKRSAKKGGGWTVTNKVNYYELLPDGEENLLNDEDAKKTTSKLKDIIGDEKDFEMLVLATEKNLDDLIGLTTTESGKVLTRLIGLEVIENKEVIVRKMYNDFDKKKKSNDYDVVTLGSEIDEHLEKISLGTDLESQLTERLTETKEELNRLSNENDELLNKKVIVDVTINTLNPSKLKEDIEEITKKGLGLKDGVGKIEAQINEIGEVIFDEDKHHLLTKEFNKNSADVMITKSEITRRYKMIEDLLNSEICITCNRKLDDVDNSTHVEKTREEIRNLDEQLLNLQNKGTDLTNELTSLNETKQLVDKKNKLELDKDRFEVEMGGLRNKMIQKRNDLKQYELNQSAIEFNKKIDIDVSLVKTKISVANHSKDDLIIKLEKIKVDIQGNKTSIETKKALIEQIKKEEEVEKIYKLYIELVGKKGISKLVLRSVLPIINAELQRLLDEVCDFEIEIFIDDKNDVQFLLNKDGVSKLLKSGSGLEKTAASLALRSVLGKISTLPMPNFITFDEVLGKVANENIEKLRPLFDKIGNMYEIVFLITHNDIIKDWGKNIITVCKTDNISSISLK